MIIYFTGTGNSRYCAQMLAAKLGDELIDASRLIKAGVAAELRSARSWVFVSPTYAWQIPRVFADFIRGGSFAGCKAAYFVMTCGDDIGNAGARLSRLCEDKGLEYRGVLKVVMPENYVAMFEVPDAEDSARIIAAAKPVLEAGIERIRQSEPFPDARISIVDRLKTACVNPPFYRFSVTARPFFVTAACIGCGICENACPLNNIRLKDGKPVWGVVCTHCMACICGCPEEAIEYGKRSKGKPRYSCGEYLPE